MLNLIKTSIAVFLLLSGVALAAINVYGEFKSIRPSVFFNDELRFQNDQPTEFKNTMSQLVRLEGESDLLFSKRVTKVIAEGIAHIHWERYNAEKFNQLIPLWENYFLISWGSSQGFLNLKNITLLTIKEV